MKAVYFVAAILIIPLAFVVPACAKPPVGLPAEIPVGCLLASSAAPAWGPNLIKATQVGVESVNSQGGIEGKPLKLIFQDEGPTPATSLYAAHELVEQNGVQVIIGGTTSEDVMAVGPYVDSKGVLSGVAYGNIELIV